MMSTKKYQGEMDELLTRICDAAFAAGYQKRDREIIRCRDCKHRGTHVMGDAYACLVLEAVMSQDDFCSAGEKEDKGPQKTPGQQ